MKTGLGRRLAARGVTLAAACGLLACVQAGGQARNAPVPEPRDYRMSAYNAPVPTSLRGAVVIDTGQAHDLWRRQAAVFIDALPRVERPAKLPATVLWRVPPRPSIPGAVWLANTGYGALAVPDRVYFEDHLTRLSAGRKDTPLVFFCKANCWMSWNAAKRAVALGYRAVHWFPAGTDGWRAAGWPLENVTPPPRPSASGG